MFGKLGRIFGHLGAGAKPPAAAAASGVTPTYHILGF